MCATVVLRYRAQMFVDFLEFTGERSNGPNFIKRLRVRIAARGDAQIIRTAPESNTANPANPGFRQNLMLTCGVFSPESRPQGAG